MPRKQLPPEVHRIKSRPLSDGKPRYYFYLRGRPKSRFWSDTVAVPRDPAFHEAYAVAQAEGRPKMSDYLLPRLVDDYLDSPMVRAKAPRTKADYRKWALRFAEEFTTAPAKMFEEPEARSIINDWRKAWSHSPKQYDEAGKIVRQILNWAVEEGKLLQHHWRFASHYQSDRATIVWAPEHVAAVLREAPEWVRRILVAATETGLRPQDLIKLSRNQIESTPNGRRIRVRTQKRGQFAYIPVTQAMGRVLDKTPPDRLLILVSARELPLTEHRASEGLKQWRNKAGLTPEALGYTLRLQDCRGTAATRLLQAGLSLGEIATHMAWSLRTASKVIENYAEAHLDPAESDAVLVKLDAARRAKTGTEL